MDVYEHAAEALADTDAIFIGAGAGMGVDSGLPDFRGNEGFWRAYPPFQKLGLSFIDLANPEWFFEDPRLAWGFYGHRLNLYRATVPHEGFQILRRWAASRAHGAFACTSNVDGQFQRAGFDDDAVFECHGSIHHLQCTRRCSGEIWEAEGIEVTVDDEFRAEGPLPDCERCSAYARPNILMFGDAHWLAGRSDAQEERMSRWIAGIRRPAVVEMGAGTAIPSIRIACERVARRFGVPLIRINPRESQGGDGTISIASGALDALQRIDAML